MESDDHNAQVGETDVVWEVVAGVAAIRGVEGLKDLAVDLAVQLAELIERIATEEGLAAVDVADARFLD